ncbi:MAG: monovalent cation/H(+) antiporter subunit G [Anaerolineales bacterium]|nr:monovalent cation/H(+) antiporter subunit G [Anaerolineales bacterium]
MTLITQLINLFSLILILGGAVLIFVAGIGLLTMPDMFLRMSASTKAATLGVGLILLGTGFYLGTMVAIGRAFLIFLFILATIPVSAHLIGRAAYSDGVPLWEGTKYNQLEGQYDEAHHILSSDVADLPPTRPAPTDELA